MHLASTIPVTNAPAIAIRALAAEWFPEWFMSRCVLPHPRSGKRARREGYETGGRRVSQGRARSSWADSRISVASANGLPVS